MATKRKRGSSWEYIIKRKALLDKPFTRTFADEAEGDTFIAKVESLLDRGIIPHELMGSGDAHKFLSDLIKEYLVKVVVPDSDKAILNVLYARIGTARISEIHYQWLEAWISKMKVELNLKPGTIRHHVGALGRCFDWAGRRNISSLAVNPIRQLPKSYAQYTAHDTGQAIAFNAKHEQKEDEERERRLESNEETRIRAILARERPYGRQRPLELRYQAALELMLDLALETAMRLREMFTLTLDQVDIDRRTVFLDRTKNGNKRQVPLSSVAVCRIQEYMALVRTQQRGMEGFSFAAEGRLFPWWNSTPDKAHLRMVTQLLSRQYARIFSAALCNDLTFHDLRHEATSRFFERTSMSDFEIMKITGHSSTRMLRRYGNLRGSFLASKLW